MRSLLVALLLTASPSSAGDLATAIWEAAPPAVGQIIVRNPLVDTSGVNVDGHLQVETPRGPVVFAVHVTINNACGPTILCPDDFEVIEVPPGLLVLPDAMTIEEEGEGTFLVYEEGLS